MCRVMKRLMPYKIIKKVNCLTGYISLLIKLHNYIIFSKHHALILFSSLKHYDML